MAWEVTVTSARGGASDTVATFPTKRQALEFAENFARFNKRIIYGSRRRGEWYVVEGTPPESAAVYVRIRRVEGGDS